MSKRLLVVLIVLLICLVLAICLPSIVVHRVTRNVRIHATQGGAWLNNVPKGRVVLVMGAGVWPGGKPTVYMERRVRVAAELYKNGKARKLLMSGNSRNVNHSEPAAMQRLAMDLGVPASAIVLDNEGFSTYESCYRAKYVYNLKTLLIATQPYHLARSVMLCRALGIDAVGVAAQQNGRDATTFDTVREILSTDKAVWQALTKPRPNSVDNEWRPF